MAFYLYALLPETVRPWLGEPLTGLDGAPVHLQSLAPFLVAYSEAKQTRYLASRANLLGHEKVLETLMQRLEPHRVVPLPLQFGLVVEDWESPCQELIEGRKDGLLAALARLAGKREVGVKILWNREEELQRLLAANAPLQQQRNALMGKILTVEEAIAVGQVLEAALEERQQEIIDRFLAVLQPLSHEMVTGELLTETMLYNGAFLIDLEKEPAFAEAVEQLDVEFGRQYRIRYNNYTAPYNFVSLAEP
ncbi:MAG: GvpL/GvpF family gas vesicle protein [Oscillatoriales cyanobacterium SM2_1_8]|nr:GvpL/GvpF family gas vesicle protein [Oscillatoriales cyanobacterium SM2_1_8]